MLKYKTSVCKFCEKQLFGVFVSLSRKTLECQSALNTIFLFNFTAHLLLFDPRPWVRCLLSSNESFISNANNIYLLCNIVMFSKENNLSINYTSIDRAVSIIVKGQHIHTNLKNVFFWWNAIYTLLCLHCVCYLKKHR